MNEYRVIYCNKLFLLNSEMNTDKKIGKWPELKLVAEVNAGF